ncbi:hypothetical protein GCM10022403_019210 [Streptomyces coacervatus]|uniref:Uncharacterized protein n=1 Tax=Streptomyces coacervatus TaxID=647381 RepID=A0ABP7H4V3_9ACTN
MRVIGMESDQLTRGRPEDRAAPAHSEAGVEHEDHFELFMDIASVGLGTALHHDDVRDVIRHVWSRTAIRS